MRLVTLVSALMLGAGTVLAQPMAQPIHLAAGPPDTPLRSLFRIKWDGRIIRGVTKVSPLVFDVQVVDYREGNDPNNKPRKSPGESKYEPITLERGITTDNDFEDWAKAVATGAATFRKDVILEILNEAGQVVRVYKIYRCWVSEYQAVPALDANGNAVLVEHIRLENEGWERDASVVAPP